MRALLRRTAVRAAAAEFKSEGEVESARQGSSYSRRRTGLEGDECHLRLACLVLVVLSNLERSDRATEGEEVQKDLLGGGLRRRSNVTDKNGLRLNQVVTNLKEKQKVGERRRRWSVDQTQKQQKRRVIRGKDVHG